MLRKNVAGQNLSFAMVNATSGAALTGATVTARRSIDGGAQATCTGTVSELGNGQYNLALSQADVNGNNIGYLFTAASAVPVHIMAITTAADPTDAAAFGLTRLDATVSSRSTYAGADTAGTSTLLSRLTGTRATNLDNLDAAVSTRSTYAGADTAGTTTLLSRLTSGRAGNLDNLDAAVSTRSSHSAADVWAVTTRSLTTFGTLVADIWAATGRTLTAFGFSVTASSVTDKTGYSLASAYDPAKTAAQAGDAMSLTTGERSSMATAVWAAGTRTLTSFGTVAADVWASATRTLSDKTGFALTSAYDPAKTAAQAGDAMALTTGERGTLVAAVWAAGTRTLTGFGTLVADIWAAVVDSSGVATLLARLTSGRASGLDNLTNLDAAVSTRLAAGAYTAPDNAGIAAVQSVTDALPTDIATVGDVPTAEENANGLLFRADAVEPGWTLRSALRIMLAALGGDITGADTTTVHITAAGSAQERITATVDEHGNRSLTMDVS